MKTIRPYCLKKIIFFTLFYFTSKNIFSQIIFEGKITSAISALPLPNVSICLTYNGKIVAYTISGETGSYRLKAPVNYNNDSSYQLQYTCIGYQKKLLNIKPSSTVYDVQLNQAATQLPDIEVNTSLKVVSKNDTLTYDVASFAQKQDRKIGDVIKNLPGIEVLDNGRILFNGQAISNFYIDGDDLLGDRYNIASNALPANMVEKIQVLQNHQPIKALKKIRASDDVALNLKLKDIAKLKVNGVAEPGAGFIKKYDASIAVLGFFKKQKFINVVKANNIGSDIKAEINQLNYKKYINSIDKDETGKFLVPDAMYLSSIKKERYFNNNSLLVTFNNLVKLKKDVQVKTNLVYLPEKVIFSQKNETNVFLQNDTIRYFENQYSVSKGHQLTGEIELNVNKPDYYFNNKVSFQKDKDSYTTDIQRTGNPILQDYINTKILFSNDFSMLKVIKGKRIVEFFSYLSNNSMNEKADWQKGLFPALVNDSIDYLRTVQTVSSPTFFTNNYFSFGNRFGRYFTQYYKLGALYQQQKLVSGIDLLQPGNNFTKASDSFSNDFTWKKYRAYLNISNEWNKGDLKINLMLPVNYAWFISGIQKVSRFYLNPRLSIRYNVGLENSLSMNASASNDFGNLQSLYQGYIIKNYRTVTANSGLLKEQKQRNLSAGFNFRKSAKIFFANIMVGYSIIESNTINASQVTGFLDRKLLLPINNKQRNWFINIGTSKYLFNYGATVNFKTGLQKGTYVQLINNELQSFNSNNFNVTFNLTYKKSNWFNCNYKSVFDVNVSKPFKSNSNQNAFEKLKLFQFQQSIENVFYLPKNIQVKLTANQFYNNNRFTQIKSNAFFADFSLQYNIKKLRADAELICLNIFNKREFTNLILFSNTIIDSKIALNPRMLIAKVSFVF